MLRPLAVREDNKALVALCAVISAFTLLALAITLTAQGGTSASVTARELTALEDPQPLNLAGASTALIFGDSWATGSDPDWLGYAPVLGSMMNWQLDVVGGPGTGYLNAGPHMLGTYAERIAELPDSTPDIVVLQGGINDAWGDRTALEKTATDTILSMKARFPHAVVVVVGPAPTSYPVGVRLEDVDQKLAKASVRASVAYISPLQQDWFPANEIDTLIDATADYHPTSEGRQVFAERLAAALHALP